MLSLLFLASLVGQKQTAEARVSATEQKILAATVRIIDPTRQAEGSGTVIGKAGGLLYVLTARHVVGDADTVDVQSFTFADATPRNGILYHNAEIMARATDSDLAILRLPAPKFVGQPLPICPPKSSPEKLPLRVCTAVCRPAGLPACASNRIMRKKRVKKPGGDQGTLYWVMENPPKSGDSGGAAVDQRGYVIGVCSGKAGKTGYFCHLEEIRRFLRAEGLQWLYNRSE